MKMSVPSHSHNRAFHSHNLFISSFFLQVVYDRGEMYSFSKYGRFCQEIKLNYSPYKNYFTRVFWNRSYHVYKVNSVISFQYWLGFCLSWWCMVILYLALCINVMENTWIPRIWKGLLTEAWLCLLPVFFQGICRKTSRTALWFCTVCIEKHSVKAKWTIMSCCSCGFKPHGISRKDFD